MAVGTYALTSLAEIQALLGSAYAAADATLWELLVDLATGILERDTQQLLKSRDYTREIYDGMGGHRLYLKHYPVSQVKRVSVGRAQILTIKNTTAVTRAEVEVTATAIILRADGAGTPMTLTLASYAMINLLKAAIELVPGWHCDISASEYGLLAATELLRRPAMACKDPSEAWLEVPDEDLTDYYLENPDEDRNQGILVSPYGFERGTQNIFVDYTAGFMTVPNELEGACLMIAKFLYDQVKKDLAVQSETLGDYSYTLAAVSAANAFGIPETLRPIIEFYKRVRII